MHRGYYKSWRKITDSVSWSRGLEYRGLIHSILVRVNHKPIPFRGEIVPRGSFAVVMTDWVVDLNINRQKLQRMLKTLCGEPDNFISVQNMGNRFSIVTVLNWELYQSEEEAKRATDDTTNGQPMGNRRATDGQQNKNNKNIRIREEEKKEECSASADAVDVNEISEPDFYLTKKKRKLTGKRLESFERFWSAFEYKRGKAEAADAWLDIPKLTNTLVEQICFAASQEAVRRSHVVASGKTPIMAQGWITGRRWEDDLVEPGPNTGNTQTDQNIIVAQQWAAGEAV